MKKYLEDGSGRNEIICNYCSCSLGIDEYMSDEISIKYDGNNYDYHICDQCKKVRDKAYDDYVDPLNAYH